MLVKKTIAVDIDDVLAFSAIEFIRFSNQRWGTNLTIEDYNEDWTTMWGIELAETQARSAEWHLSGVSAKKNPRDEATEVLKKLKKSYRLIVATSRKLSIQSETIAWIDEHFKYIFEGVHFSGIWDNHTLESRHLTKAEMCKSIGADYLIDDQAKHCIGAAGVGVPALLFGDFTWNRHIKIPTGVTRVKDWPAVLEYFDGIR